MDLRRAHLIVLLGSSFGLVGCCGCPPTPRTPPTTRDVAPTSKAPSPVAAPIADEEDELDPLQWPVVAGTDDVILRAAEVLIRAKIEFFRDADLLAQWLAVSKEERPRALEVLAEDPLLKAHLVTSDPEPDDVPGEPRDTPEK